MVRLLVLGIFLFMMAIPSHAAKEITLSGRKLSCFGADVVIDNSMPSEGAASADVSVPSRGAVYINQRMIRKLSKEVQWFVFYHECGHLHQGRRASESRSDRYGIYRGVMDGWLTNKTQLNNICKSFEDAPASREHPSGRKRCRDNEKWFDEFYARKKAYDEKVNK